MTTRAINNRLLALSNDPGNFKALPASSVSYHRQLCLGMAKIQNGRPSASEKVNPAELMTPGETDEAIIRETKTLSLALFRHKLKTQPGSVSMKDLTPVLTAILRLEGKGNKRDPLDDAMEGAIGSADEDEEQASPPSTD